MVVIRLARFGTKNRPKYRVTVADHRRYVTSKFLEVVGTYNPKPQGKEIGLTLDLTKIDAWVKKGAQPSERVRSLIRQAQTGQK